MGSVSVQENYDPDGILDEETLDEEFHYRYVRNTPSRVANMRKRGYELVSRSKDGVQTMHNSGDDGTDVIVHGDRVLMKIPKEVKLSRDQQKQHTSEARLKGPAERFRTEAAKASRQVGIEIKTVSGTQAKEPKAKGEK